MAKTTNISQNTTEVSDQVLISNKSKQKNLRRATSDNIAEVFDSQLKRGNVFIIDGLKYRFNGKDKLVIDKNAKKSADLQRKEYKDIIDVSPHELKLKLLEKKPYAPKYEFEVKSLDEMKIDEVRRRIELATMLDGYGVEMLSFGDFKRELSEIEGTEELKKKLDRLKGKPYAPEYAFHVKTLDKIGIDEVKKRIELATKLDEYGVEIISFHDFERNLSEIERTENLEEKLDQLKGKPYAPEYVFQVKRLDEMDIEEVKRRIELEAKLEEYDVKAIMFDDFKGLSEIEWTEGLKEKLDQLKGKSYAPEYVFRVKTLDEMDMEEIKRRVELATKLKEYNIKSITFDDFEFKLADISFNSYTKRNNKTANASQNSLEASGQVSTNNVEKQKSLYRATSDNVADVFDPQLKKGNVVIVDGLKYRFNGKDRLVIDKNAKKSADLQRKEYKDVIVIFPLELKLNLLKGKPYAPEYAFQVKRLDEMDIEEVRGGIELATKLEKYGVETIAFEDFKSLSEIKWTEGLKEKLDQLKGKPYAPKYVFQVKTLDEMDMEEIKRRIELATKLEQNRGRKIYDFHGFEREIYKQNRYRKNKKKNRVNQELKEKKMLENFNGYDI